MNIIRLKRKVPENLYVEILHDQNYYNTANDVKVKMQIGALTVKITENINKINDLFEVDKNIKKDIVDNSNSIENINKDVTNNFNRISINEKNINLKQIQ